MNGWLPAPLGMVTSSRAPGTPAGVQFVAVFQSVDVPPFQVRGVGGAAETARVPVPVPVDVVEEQFVLVHCVPVTVIVWEPTGVEPAVVVMVSVKVPVPPLGTLLMQLGDALQFAPVGRPVTFVIMSPRGPRLV